MSLLLISDNAIVVASHKRNTFYLILQIEQPENQIICFNVFELLYWGKDLQLSQMAEDVYKKFISLNKTKWNILKAMQNMLINI